MIKIIVEGDRDVIDKYYFTCKHCDTEFVCDYSDLTPHITGTDNVNEEIRDFSIKCPLCKAFLKYSSRELDIAHAKYLNESVDIGCGKKVYL
jgi:hypothetical protein